MSSVNTRSWSGLRPITPASWSRITGTPCELTRSV